MNVYGETTTDFGPAPVPVPDVPKDYPGVGGYVVGKFYGDYVFVGGVPVPGHERFQPRTDDAYMTTPGLVACSRHDHRCPSCIADAETDAYAEALKRDNGEAIVVESQIVDAAFELDNDTDGGQA